ncbi:hypothetical protein BKP45_07045 [Anaerobacillus alkalidiazotrophicus]|uniref:Transposase n=1 Tax=Anaerobacillus alkalidiazotrophicus TaxID=472963 RepID=A0A1S2MFB9_9BACI|nr:Rpn family recombination-promoting nuclease/putative transposase [Anaerobacillus alkalidiazotrophicus]OIJ22385.1 hypothetical protein BKP45_07045 [Anaerobacillus alkalidiazotrophicus]
MQEELPINWLKPKNDFVFKLLFGSEDEGSNQLLLAFLNDVLDVPEGQSLAKVEILNPNLNKKFLKDKEAILDVRARVVGLGYINVEIQLTNQKNIHKRSLFYASRLYEGQLGEKGKYRTLTKVVAINLIDFNYFQSEDYRRCFGLKEDGTLEPFPDDLMKLHFFEMPKFRALDKNGKIATNDRMAKWLRFLTNTDDTRWEEMAKQDPMLELSVEKLRLASMDPEIRMQYEAREKALRDIESIRDDALEEGKLEGKLEGKEEGKEEVAQTMLREGMEISFVIRMTGLSREVVENLASKLKS